MVTFEEVLIQAIAMLHRFERVSYRALIRQFALDEAYFADLKDALLYAYPHVVDDGRGLIWPGATEAPPEGPPLGQGARPTPGASPRPLVSLILGSVDDNNGPAPYWGRT
jgi:hypothetical protein